MALQLYISILSALEFRQGAYDLGLSMQAFSNTGSGYFFWGAGPYFHHGTISILDNHFSWVYFAVYPIYAAFPGQITLFVVQAVPISLAAIPLASLATEASGSPRKGLLVAGIYLLWAPMYAGMPNSFHLEGFLPVLFFSLVLTWYRKQYVLGLVLGVITGFTIDAAPVFTALIAVMFLTYPLQDAVGMVRRSRVQNPGRSAVRFSSRVASAGRQTVRAVVNFTRLPAARAGFALLVVSVVVFFSMRYLETTFVGWLGYHGYVLPITRNLGSPSNFFVNFDYKVEFWLVILATVGFLPLLYPRVLIVLGPWVGYTFLQQPYGWYVLPSHYVAIAAVPLFIGMALGIGILPLRYHASPTVSSRENAKAAAGDGPPPLGAVSQAQPRVISMGPARGLHGGSRRSIAGILNDGAVGQPSPTLVPPRIRRGKRSINRARWMYVGSVALVLGVLVANVGLNPVNPVTAGIIAASGDRLFTGAGDPYSLTLNPAPGYEPMVQLADLIPSNASVLVQGQFYPLVSSDPNAYPYNGVNGSNPPTFNPFNTTHLPEYILATRAGLRLFSHTNGSYIPNADGSYPDTMYPSKIAWNSAIYGVEGWVQSTRLGSVFLFEHPYSGGPTRNFGPISYPQIRFSVGATPKVSTLKPVDNGTRTHLKKSNTWVISITNRTGRMWLASDSGQSLPAGKYGILVDVRTLGAPTVCEAAANEIAPLLSITAYNVPTNPQVFPTLNVSYQEHQCGDPFSSTELKFSLPHPVANIDIYGAAGFALAKFHIYVDWVEIIPLGPLPS